MVVASVILLGVSGCGGEQGSGGTGLPGAGQVSSATGAPTRPPSGAADGLPLVPVELTVATGASPGRAAGRSLNVPNGWRAEVWADVPGARLAAWAPDGRLIVSTGRRGVLAVLTPTSDGRAPTVTTMLDGLDGPQGVAFTKRDGRDVLVVGEETRIVTWDYAGGALSNRRVLIDGLPSSGHGGKAVVVQIGRAHV